MSEELKPCPFCGSSDVTIGTNYRGENSASYYAFCRTCKADTRGFPSKETTLNEWNTRAYEAEIEFLKNRVSTLEDDLNFQYTKEDALNIQLCAYEAEIEGLKLELKCFNAQRDKDIHLLHEAKAQLSVALEQLKLAYAFCKGLDGEEKFHADKLGEAIQQIEG